MGKKSTTDKFIEKANIVHKNKYDYSLVNYISKSINVKIICKIHGIFEQTPDHHLCGCNCQKCSILIKKSNTKKHQNLFLKNVVLNLIINMIILNLFINAQTKKVLYVVLYMENLHKHQARILNLNMVVHFALN